MRNTSRKTLGLSLSCSRLSTLSYSIGVLVDFGIKLIPINLEDFGLSQPAVTTFWMIFYKTNIYIYQTAGLLMALLRMACIKFPIEFHQRYI